MAISTLAELRSAVADFGMGRTDISSGTIDNMIYLAEADIHNGSYGALSQEITPPLRVREMETAATLNLTSEYTNLPSDFLELKSLAWISQTGKPPLKRVSQETFDSTYSSGDSGPARAYVIVGSQIRVGPGASTSDSLKITYYGKVPALVTNSTNWLLTGYPNVYLYGALRHFAPYIGAMDMLAIWQPAFISAIAGLIQGQRRGSYSGTSVSQRSIGMTGP